MKTVNDRFVVVTYLIYIVFWQTMIFGGFGYIIFVLGHTAWWAIVAMILWDGAYTPEQWQRLLSRYIKDEEQHS